MDGESPTQIQARVAKGMLRYLTQHPAAKDTADGIATWWLRQERIERSVEAVHDALALLVSRDLLLEHRGPDRRTYYGINARRLDDIAAFLDEGRR